MEKPSMVVVVMSAKESVAVKRALEMVASEGDAGRVMVDRQSIRDLRDVAERIKVA